MGGWYIHKVKRKEGKNMKEHTTMKSICNYWGKVYRCGYAELQFIMRHTEPKYYNSGVYGWNCDIYVDYKRDIAITTGYRNMRGTLIPHELIKKYSNIAEEISKNWSVPYEETKRKLEENAENFWNEVDNL